MNTLFSTIQEFIVNIFVSILPTSTGLPENVSEAFSTFIGYLNGFNLIFPISTMFQILTIYIGFQLAVFTFYFVRFMINLVRGSGA